MEENEERGGRKWDAGKTQFSLLMPEFLELAANILTEGAKNHPPEPNGDPSWMYVEPKAYMDSLLRHVNALRKGEHLDKDMKSHHCGHIFCNAMFTWYLTFYETWADIPEFEGLYQASDMGRVRSLDRMITDSVGRETLIIGTLLKQYINRGGYRCVSLHNGGKTRTKTVHRLVLAAFIGPCPDGCETMHLDGIKTNNKLDNLRYGSHTCNLAFTLDHGTAPHGENASSAKFTNAQVKEIRRAWAMGGVTKSALAREYGVDRATIRGIVNNKVYKEKEENNELR
jgi:hypothetical protein